MKRRNFIRTAGIAGLSAGVALETSSCSNTTTTEIKKPDFYKGEIKEKSILKNLENEFLKLVVYSDASLDILDKKRKTQWRTGPVAMQEEGSLDIGHVWIRQDRSVCEQYPGRFIGEKYSDILQYTMLGRQNEIMGKFKCNFQLDKDELILRMIDIEEQIPSLVFPPPIISQSLILPSSQGLWIKKPFNVWHRQVYKLFSQVNMRWFGGLKGENGWMAIFEEGWADGCILGITLTLSSGFLKSMNHWTPRSLRYCFTDNGYVGMAKRYRKWAMDHGIFKSLKEKAEHLPQLKNLFGGRFLSVFLASAKRREQDVEDQLIPVDDKLKQEIKQAKVNWHFKDATEIFEKAKSLGMKKGTLCLQGWIKDGYDASHPDIWPPEPLIGSIEEIKKACSENGSYFTMLHDNYQDIYETSPSFPNGVNINIRDRLMTGGIWSERQCYILNSKNSIEYAKRNWENLKTLGQQGMYIDTTTTMQLFESFEKGNTQTRLQDYQRKCELMKFFYDNGMVLGSEQISEISVLSNSLGMMHGRELDRIPGERIPLWHLVFHDTCLITTAIATPITEENKKMYYKCLEDMLYGCLLTTGIWSDKSEKGMKGMFEYLVNTLHVDQWHNQIATDEMITHRFVSEDNLVEETEFSSGKKIICNFSNEPRTIDGKQIASCDYLIVS